MIGQALLIDGAPGRWRTGTADRFFFGLLLCASLGFHVWLHG